MGKSKEKRPQMPQASQAGSQAHQGQSQEEQYNNAQLQKVLVSGVDSFKQT